MVITQAEVPTEERIIGVLNHLGIKHAHFAARLSTDWQALVSTHPERGIHKNLLIWKLEDRAIVAGKKALVN